MNRSVAANPIVQAPHLNQLAEEGVVFERAYCPSPLCVPSRAAMMTGLLPSNNGAYDNAGDYPASMPTMAHQLRRAGYTTTLAGKMHFIGPDQLHGFERRLTTDVYPAGFDWIPDWDSDRRFPWYHDMSSVFRAGPVRATLQIDYDQETAYAARRALTDAARQDRPFFIAASFTFPHDPFEVPRQYWDPYEGVEIDDPVIGPDANPDPHTNRLLAMIETDLKQPSPEEIRAARRAYYGAVSFVDDVLGDLLATLRHLRLRDDTVVIFTSDHGEMLGEHGLWYKMSPFEGSLGVPLIIAAPTRFQPRRVTTPVSTIDLYPTVVQLAGSGDSATNLDGQSLVPLLEGGSDHDPVAAEYLAEGLSQPQVILIDGQWKLVRCPGDPDLLFDLEHDPNEVSNLAGTGLEAEARMSEMMDRRWNLVELRGQVVESQKRRRVVAEALATGTITSWDYRPPGDGYIGTGQDFWTTLEGARLD